jgi:S-DNA-T family DNA segregation ATPase FtsK/SpoIIIE
VRAGAPSLPEGRRISLAILSGPDQGKIVVVDRPKMVLGRSDSDIVLADPEISRQHAVVEIYEDKYLVRDLNSTNGTFVGDRRITAEEVENHGEFRVGGSRMMLIVTTPEE